MKTIAFLGALFVPATFVSVIAQVNHPAHMLMLWQTLFAMPLFNWSAPTTSEIITNHFWIYGAVTGPLTVVTMAIVGYWILSRTQKNLDNKDPTSDEPRPSRFAPLKQKLKLRKRRSFRTEDSVWGWQTGDRQWFFRVLSFIGIFSDMAEEIVWSLKFLLPIPLSVFAHCIAYKAGKLAVFHCFKDSRYILPSIVTISSANHHQRSWLLGHPW